MIMTIAFMASWLWFGNIILRYRRELLREGIEPNPGPADFTREDWKEGRRKLREKQSEDKRDSLRINYQLAFKDLKHPWILTGDLELDCYSFYELLHKQGYASNTIPVLPLGLLKSIFSRFVDGYGLQHLQKVTRQYYSSKQNMTEVRLDNTTPEPGRDARKLLLKYYLIYYYHHHKLLCELLSKKKISSQVFEWFTTKLSDGVQSVGSNMAKGFMTEVKPVWDSAVNKLKELKDSLFGSIKNSLVAIGAGLIVTLLGILGFSMLYKYRNYLLESWDEKFVSQGLDDIKEEEKQSEWFFTRIAKWGYKLVVDDFCGWANSFSEKFEGEAFAAKLKSLGNLSGALNNIHSLMIKVRDILCWVLDKVWKFIFNTPFFQSSKEVEKLTSRINDLLKRIQIVSKDLSINEQRQFVKDVEELYEYMCFLKNVILYCILR
jgi:hypothetical protein